MLGKLLCKIGIHSRVQKRDELLTKATVKVHGPLGLAVIGPAYYLECIRCGYSIPEPMKQDEYDRIVAGK